jgi:hypothetical protein
MNELASLSILAHITNVTIERHEYVLPLVVKKNVIAASVSSMEAFSTMGLTLQLEVPTPTASIPDPKVGGEC